MMSWFTDTFLPSLLSRAGVEHGLWLSRKQTAICLEHMECHTVLQAEFQGDYRRHNYYTMEWGERSVRLDYSKLNGCGVIVFGMNNQEKAEANARRETEKQRLEAERLERIWKNPERLEKWRKRSQEALDRAEHDLELCKQDLLAAQASGDMEEVKLCLEDIKFAEEVVAEKLADWRKYYDGD